MNAHRIVLIGYSDFARRTIVPAIESLPALKLVGIASRSHARAIPLHIPAYRRYDRAIDQSQAHTVYISLHNSSHAKWIEYALSRGKHVIVDKPAVLTKREAQTCLLASRGTLLLWESLPYLFHPQYQAIKTYLARTKSPIQSITAHFGFPMLAAHNFRNTLSLGGGCLYDIAPYLVSVGSHLTGRHPTRVHVRILAKDRRGLPLRAAVEMTYPDTICLQGLIGFGLEYRNYLAIWGNNFLISLDRAFTLPPAQSNTVFLR